MWLNEIQQANALAEAKQAKEKRCVMRSSKPTKLSAREAQNHWFSTETESITKESEKLREGVREGERETPPPRRDWPKLEAALVQKNGKDSDMFCRRSHVTESEGCGGGGFLLRYSGKCNYGWTGAWRSRCGCLKVCKGSDTRGNLQLISALNFNQRVEFNWQEHEGCFFSTLEGMTWIRRVFIKTVLFIFVIVCQIFVSRELGPIQMTLARL